MRKPALALFTAAALVATMTSAALAQSGRLEPGDATLDSGEYIDVYEHQLEAGDTVVISITSQEFDPYLVIVDPNDGVDFQVDDSPGAGLNVEEEYTAPISGLFLIIVTSALAEETGSYLLSIEEADSAPANPLGGQQAGNPLAPTPEAADRFAGEYSSADLTLVAEAQGAGSYAGNILFNGATMPFSATANGDVLNGTFSSGGGEFEFTARLNGTQLEFTTGGTSYLLEKAGANEAPVNPLGVAAAPVQVPAGARTFEPRLAVTPELPAVQPEPGYIKGVVLDRHGDPIGGATVAVYGTTIAGANTRFEATTGADGSYRQRVPDGIYGVSAYAKTNYAGERFEIPVPAADGNNSIDLDAAQGGVENFVWFLEGLREAGLSPDDEYSYHGMSLTLSSATSFAAAGHLAGGFVELLLTPSGPLIDGSEGRPLVYLHQLGSDAGTVGPTEGGYVDLDTEILDIPLGSYTVTARLLSANGTATPLRLSGWCCSPEDLTASFALAPVPYDVVRSPVPFPTLYVAP